MVDVTADKDGLTIVASGDVRLRLFAAGIAPSQIVAGRWELPGLDVQVSSDAKGFTQAKNGETVDVIYTGMTRMTLRIHPIDRAHVDMN